MFVSLLGLSLLCCLNSQHQLACNMHLLERSTPMASLTALITDSGHSEIFLNNFFFLLLLLRLSHTQSGSREKCVLSAIWNSIASSQDKWWHVPSGLFVAFFSIEWSYSMQQVHSILTLGTLYGILNRWNLSSNRSCLGFTTDQRNCLFELRNSQHALWSVTLSATQCMQLSWCGQRGNANHGKPDQINFQKLNPSPVWCHVLPISEHTINLLFFHN